MYCAHCAEEGILQNKMSFFPHVLSGVVIFLKKIHIRFFWPSTVLGSVFSSIDHIFTKNETSEILSLFN